MALATIGKKYQIVTARSPVESQQIQKVYLQPLPRSIADLKATY